MFLCPLRFSLISLCLTTTGKASRCSGPCGIKQGTESSLCVKFPAIAVTDGTGNVLHISFVFHSIL